MAQKFQFDGFESPRKTSSPLCIACEEMLTDALDHTLGTPDQTWFDRHLSTCADCTQRFADAQRGAAWLELLKTPRPEPSSALLERIFAQTSGLGIQTSGLNLQPSGFDLPNPDLQDPDLRNPDLQNPDLQAPTQPSLTPPLLAPFTAPFLVPTLPPQPLPTRILPLNVLPFRPRFANLPAALFEPRLAMTAAMAFFSLALTLNLTGVQLNQLHLSDLKPSALKHNYYEANAGAARFYDNLRVVHVLESRVDDLRQAAADNIQPNPQPSTQPAPQPKSAPRKPAQSTPEPGPGQSLRQPSALASRSEGGLA